MSDTILVTGGTGSFGSAFIRHLTETTSATTWRRIICYSRDEFKQSQLRATLTDDRLRWFIGDVRDADRLGLAIRDVQVIVHAAALKQVPTMEENPIEAVRTNVEGSLNVFRVSLQNGVHKLLALSTDKACSPINLYGATKLVMERLFLSGNTYCGPKCSVVRYGNVAGSRGSVIPLFREHLSRGQSVPITDPEMTRFHITIPQAVVFVEQKLQVMQGGEVFVPKMPSVRVLEVAQALGATRWHTVGIRPGEKLHETVVGAQERVQGLPSPYTSDGNTEWLTGDSLKHAVEAV